MSQQDHYDFTLRTLGTVLSMAGNLKRNIKSQPGQEKRDEEKIILSSLEDANFPKFISEDIKLFKALLTDLFPVVELDEPKVQFFNDQINQVMSKDNIVPSPFTISKCQQLIDIMNIRFGICLTGPAGSGKSTVIKMVEQNKNRYLDEIENKESEENKTKKEEQEPINEGFLKNFDQKYKLLYFKI